MSGYGRYEMIEHATPFFFKETSIFTPKTLRMSRYFSPLMEDDLFNYSFDIQNPTPTAALFDFSSPFDPVLDTVRDLVEIETTPFCSFYRRLQQRRVNRLDAEFYLEGLRDRIAVLESRFDRLAKEKLREADRKYTWTAEIKDGVERKYKWTAEIKGQGEGKEKKGKQSGERNYKWTAEIKGKDDDKRTYTWKAIIGGEKGENSKLENVKEKKWKKKVEIGSNGTRIVEIEEPFDHGAALLRQAFAKRAGGAKSKGKEKELSPQDAAVAIQISFREYLIRRSRALRALRDLANAKAKLKEIRAQFRNICYRNHVARDAEERQKFSEKIIVLLLTVDAIEGADMMVRAAKRSMVDELEAMLNAVDPHPSGRSLSARRRTFDMPSSAIQEEIAEGVAQVLQMLDE
ncbi:hypothetical protein Nepgr_020130 [Nepenthes gracilis]|uniref:BAG domain-containing protein n=1 Tax=Nepenthes gracilis TaxID=150966 RepID=A0AAD3SX27_NEPGR|nr:hypothetical protein Nepgr_020130 [Nepenthes gracilis]